jgi:probable F420-dependent oxidoreductase
MKLGAVYPQIELGGQPEALDHLARAVESMGLDHMVMYDHVVGATHEGRYPPLQGPYTDQHPFHDPLVAFGYLAAITRRIELVTGVLILPQRQTVLVAKQATEVDVLSNGRLCLGVGIGWNYVEYDALGQDFSTRGERISEQITFLRRLWAEELIDWRGQFDRINRANIVPRPRRQIPVYCGGVVEAAFKRAAILGDGFIFGGKPAKHVVPEWAHLRQLLREAGRSPKDFGAHCLIMTEMFTAQSVPEAADSIRTWEDAGGTHASIVTMGQAYTTASQHVDYLNEVRLRAR